MFVSPTSENIGFTAETKFSSLKAKIFPSWKAKYFLPNAEIFDETLAHKQDK